MDTETKIVTCRNCQGSGEQIDLTAPDGLADCRQCHGAGERRVPLTRELVNV